MIESEKIESEDQIWILWRAHCLVLEGDFLWTVQTVDWVEAPEWLRVIRNSVRKLAKLLKSSFLFEQFPVRNLLEDPQIYLNK